MKQIKDAKMLNKKHCWQINKIIETKWKTLH